MRAAGGAVGVALAVLAATAGVLGGYWGRGVVGGLGRPRVGPDSSGAAGAEHSQARLLDEHPIDFSWAPDATRLAYDAPGPAGDRNIYVALVPTGSDVLLWPDRICVAGGPSDEHGPEWSPDGKWIAYVVSGRPDHVYALEPPSSAEGEFPNSSEAPRRLVALPGPAGELRWSPDSRSIAVSWGQFDPEGASIGVLALREGDHGMAESRLMRVAVSASRSLDVAWTPSGDGLLYCSHAGHLPSVWLAPTDGTPVRQLSVGHFDGRPSPSRDGRWVAFLSAPGAGGAEASSRGEGARPQVDERVPDDAGRDTTRVRPALSGARCMVMPAGGGSAIPVSPAGPACDPMSPPAWSPDGARLAFSMEADDRTTAIFVATSRDGDWEQRPAAVRRLTYLDGLAVRPRWSPDGRYIAFCHEWVYQPGRALHLVPAPRSNAPAAGG